MTVRINDLNLDNSLLDEKSCENVLIYNAAYRTAYRTAYKTFMNYFWYNYISYV